MTILLMVSIYILIASLSTTYFTASAYKDLLREKPYEVDKFMNEDWNLKVEGNHRKKLAKSAKKTGFWYGAFWAFFIPLELILFICAITWGGINKIAIDRQDSDFNNRVAAVKAKKILAEYEKQEEAKFDKALES